MAKSKIITIHNMGHEEVEVTSYATLENLNKALTKHGFLEHRHLTVMTLDGRWTAIFPSSNITGPDGCGYMGLYSQHGFMTLG